MNIVLKGKNFLETAKIAKKIVGSMETDKLKALKAELKNKRDYLKKQALISSSKKDCEDLAEKTANLLLSIQVEENKLPVMSKKESGKSGGRGHKKAGSVKELALTPKLKKQRHNLKFVKEESQKTKQDQQKVLEKKILEFKAETGQKVPSDYALNRWHKEKAEKQYKQATGSLGGPRQISRSNKNTEFYTPPTIIKKARKVLHRIDLDPASSKEANKIVKAKKFYSKKTDGLKNDWKGNIWLNPPYLFNLTKLFVKKLAFEKNKKNLKRAIVLMNNNTETRWAQDLFKMGNAVCFPKGRIAFYKSSKEALERGGLQGQMIVGINVNVKQFIQEFSEIGYTTSLD